MQFIDLGAQRARIADRIEAAVGKVIASGAYILGPQVGEFEAQLADYVGVKHVVGCASGTDALQIPLMAKGIGPGDAVFVPSFTFAATAEVVALVGAEPVFVDIDTDTYTMDPASLEAAIGMIAAAAPKVAQGGADVVVRINQPLELAVRDIVHGREVKNREALANPEALEHFRNLPELS